MQHARRVDIADIALAVDQQHPQQVRKLAGEATLFVAFLLDRLLVGRQQRLQCGLRAGGQETPVDSRRTRVALRAGDDFRCVVLRIEAQADQPHLSGQSRHGGQTGL